MPLFSNIEDANIYGGTYYEVGGDVYHFTTVEFHENERQPRDRKRRRKRRSLSTSFSPGPRRKRRHIDDTEGQSIIPRRDLRLHQEIVVGPDYRMHSASHRSRAVVVKVFEGPQAKQACIATLKLHKPLMHPNFLQLRGVSSPMEDTSFLVFEGAYRQCAVHVVASALQTDLNRSVILGLKVICNLASALCYLRSQNLHPGRFEAKNWEIFLNEENAFVLGLDAGISSDPEATEATDVRNRTDVAEDGWRRLLFCLCEQTLHGANRLLYQDQLLREPDPSVYTSSLRSMSLNAPESLDPSFVTNQTPSATPRREFVWSAQKNQNISLEAVAAQMRDFLEISVPDGSTNPLRRVRRLPGYLSLLAPHQCCNSRLYRREEITLTPRISHSAIITHSTPTPQEVCYLCGELVHQATDLEDPPVETDIVHSSGGGFGHSQSLSSTRATLGNDQDGYTENVYTNSIEEAAPPQRRTRSHSSSSSSSSSTHSHQSTMIFSTLAGTSTARTSTAGTSVSASYEGQQQQQQVRTPIHRLEATYTLGTGPIQSGGDLDMGVNGFSDEEMLATMQALKNPLWWQIMMMPEFSWPEEPQTPGTSTAGTSVAASYEGPQQQQQVRTPIHRPEATYALGTGPLQFGGDIGVNGFSDEEMLIAMQTLKPGFSWPEEVDAQVDAIINSHNCNIPISNYSRSFKCTSDTHDLPDLR